MSNEMNLEYIDNEQAQIYVASQAHSKQGVWLPLIYIDMVNGNFSDATLLAQIMYWHLPDKKGNTKMTYKTDGHLWIAKNHGEWIEETRLKNSTVRNALDRLRQLGLIHYQVSGYGGNKTPIMRINWQNFINSLKLGRQKRQILADNSLKCGQPITENTTKIKKKKTLSAQKQADAGGIIKTDCLHYDNGCTCTQTGFELLGDCNECNAYHKAPTQQADAATGDSDSGHDDKCPVCQCEQSLRWIRYATDESVWFVCDDCQDWLRGLSRDDDSGHDVLSFVCVRCNNTRDVSKYGKPINLPEDGGLWCTACFDTPGTRRAVDAIIDLDSGQDVVNADDMDSDDDGTPWHDAIATKEIQCEGGCNGTIAIDGQYYHYGGWKNVRPHCPGCWLKLHSIQGSDLIDYDSPLTPDETQHGHDAYGDYIADESAKMEAYEQSIPACNTLTAELAAETAQRLADECENAGCIVQKRNALACLECNGLVCIQDKTIVCDHEAECATCTKFDDSAEVADLAAKGCEAQQFNPAVLREVPQPITPDNSLDEDTPASPKKKAKKLPSADTLMKNALVAAMGFKNEDVTCWGEYQAASKKLRTAKFPVDEIPALYAFCRSLEKGSYKFKSPMQLAKDLPAYRKWQRGQGKEEDKAFTFIDKD